METKRQAVLIFAVPKAVKINKATSGVIGSCPERQRDRHNAGPFRIKELPLDNKYGNLDKAIASEPKQNVVPSPVHAPCRHVDTIEQSQSD
jgi:hypothetical protein